MKAVLKGAVGIFSLAIVSFAFVTVAFASSYITWFEFEYNLTSPTRYFDGKNIQFVSSFAKSIPAPHALNKTYTVTLKRKNTLRDDTIGTVTLRRDSSGTARWSNVGKGNYYVYLLKANDGIKLRDDYVKFQNY